jgi:hypothetical protein
LLLAKARRLPFWNDHQMVADFTGHPGTLTETLAVMPHRAMGLI